MSRIGKNPVVIPDKVECKVVGNELSVKGPKGQLKVKFNDKIQMAVEGKSIVVKPKKQDNLSKALWGTTRTLASNMVKGVSEGFVRILEFNGVGYKAQVNGSILNLSLGFSHAIDYKLPEGVTAKVNKNQIEIYGSDKELVGFVASKVRSYRPPEPYKGKGVKYIEETIKRKAGKSAAKK
jgi:large subunit ribosomal protein L6